MATKRWTGGAQAVTDVWTLSLSGTVTSQTYTITVGGKTVTYTADGSATAAIIFAGFVAAWNSSTSPVPPQLKELSAVVSGSTLILTGLVAGRPHTVTFTTSGGATPTATHTTSATGPNHFDNAGNWDTGVAPANSDTLVFDNGSVPCKYGLTTTLTGITINVKPSYSGRIGLPDTNMDSTSYLEYRTTSLTLDGGTLTVNSPNVSMIRVAFGTTLATVRVLQTGQRFEPSTPVVLLTGGAASSACYVTRGDVGLGFFGETYNFPTVKIGFDTNQASDARVVCGTGGTMTTVTKTGGNLELNSGCTTLTQGPSGGVTTIQAGAFTTINVNGGEVYQNSTSTVGTFNVSNDGMLSFDKDSRAKTITNPISVVGLTAKVKDNQKVVNSGVLSVTTSGTPLTNIEHGTSNTVSLT